MYIPAKTQRWDALARWQGLITVHAGLKGFQLFIWWSELEDYI